MSRRFSSLARRGESYPATARLRAEILIAPDAEHLVSLFGDALAEHGISGHFCLRQLGAGFAPLLGDAPELIAAPHVITVDNDGRFFPGTRVLLAQPSRPLESEDLARVRGYAQLFAARALALHELADDVETDCGLSLRERYVLGRQLAGLPALDIAIEAGISVATVNACLESAIDRLGVSTVAEAIALGARRGWLAVTSLQNCSSSSEKITYKAVQNG